MRGGTLRSLRHGVPAAGRLLAGLALVSVLRDAQAAGDWIVDAAADARYDDNLPLAMKDEDIESDALLDVRLSLGRYYQLTDRVSFSFTGDLRGARHADFDGLDNLGAGITVSLRGKLGLGSESPWWRTAGGFLARDYDFDPRDGIGYFATVGAGRRFGERLDLQIGYEFERRRADRVSDIPFLVSAFGLHGDAFDGDNHTFAISATYSLTEKAALVGGYSRRIGDVCATTRIDQAIFDVSDAIAGDPVFGVDRFAYRLDADTDIFEVLLSYALGDHVSLNVSYEYRDSSDGGSFSYASNIAQIGLRYGY